VFVGSELKIMAGWRFLGTICLLALLLLILSFGLERQGDAEMGGMSDGANEGRGDTETRGQGENDNGHVKRSSSAIAITAGGALLVAVNPDSNSVTLIDAGSETALVEIPVGVDPRTVAINSAGTVAYVANRASDTISAVDLVTQEVTAEIPVGAQPYGVLISPDSSILYVAEQGSGFLHILETGSWKTLKRLSFENKPSGLALSGDGQTLYLTALLDNRIWEVDVSTPYTAYLPLVGFDGLDPVGFQFHPARTDPGIFGNPRGLTEIRLLTNSNLVQSIIIGPDDLTAYLPHTRSDSGNPNLSFDGTVTPLVSLLDLENRVHLSGQVYDLGTLDPPGVGLPFDAAVTPDGSELWVVNAASNDVTIVNLISRELAGHIEVADNPRGIVLSPDGHFAYVNNTLAGTVSVIDTGAYSVTNSILTTEIPLPPLLLQGKRLFHSSDDPRMSNAQWIACSSCHFDGEHDGRTWTFSFAGLRNTTSLAGMIETYPLRWSGEWDESADGEFAIRRENFGAGLIDGEMHCDLLPADCVKPEQPNQGRATELDALAAFMDSLIMPLSPDHRHRQPLDAAELRGQAHFLDPALGCLACHPPPLYSDMGLHDVGIVSEPEHIGDDFDTPTLRGLHASAPYYHDGSSATLLDALTRPSPNSEHDLTVLLSASELNDLIRYLLALPYE
jgi:YVTN family beta-propeller protein